MRKSFVPFVLVGLVVLTATALTAVPANQAPETIKLDACMAKKTAVEFPHAAHIKHLECKTCHHTQEGLKAGGSEEVQACSSCHLKPEKAETPSCTEMSSTKNPFHMLCVNCHKEEAKKNAETKAPTKCDGCHPKA